MSSRRSTRGAASASPAGSLSMQSPVPDVTTPSNMTPPAAPARQAVRRDPFAYADSPERPRRAVVPRPSVPPPSSKAMSARSSASPAVPATPATPVDATPKPTPNRTPSGRVKAQAVPIVSADQRGRGNAFAVPQGKKQTEAARNANKRSLDTASPISPPQKRLRTRPNSTPTRVPSTPVAKRGGNAPSAARSLNWQERRIVKTVAPASFYGAKDENELKAKKSFLVEEDGVMVRTDLKAAIDGLEDEAEDLEARIEASTEAVEKTSEKAEQVREDVEAYAKKVNEEKADALDALKGKEVSKKASSALKKNSKGKGRATDETDEVDLGMFKGKVCEAEIVKEADRLLKAGVDKIKKADAKAARAKRTNEAQKRQLERLKVDCDEMRTGMGRYYFEGRALQVRAALFQDMEVDATEVVEGSKGTKESRVWKSSASVLVPRVFVECPGIIQGKEGRKQSREEIVKRAQKRVERMVMRDFNATPGWATEDADKDMFRKLLSAN